MIAPAVSDGDACNWRMTLRKFIVCHLTIIFAKFLDVLEMFLPASTACYSRAKDGSGNPFFRAGQRTGKKIGADSLTRQQDGLLFFGSSHLAGRAQIRPETFLDELFSVLQIKHPIQQAKDNADR